MADNVTARSSTQSVGWQSEQMPAGEAAWAHFRQFARERPEVVALWAFGIGFVLGWRLKPW